WWGLGSRPARRPARFGELRPELGESYRATTGEAAPPSRGPRAMRPDDWSNRGAALNALDRRADAVTCYRRVLDLDPSNITARCNLGYALESDGLFREAIRSYDEALALDPRDTWIWHRKGVALEG